MTKRRGAGRKILSTVAAFAVAGGFLTDWNRTHLFNPAWPPHARFHDAQAVLLDTFLGAGGLYFLRGGGESARRDLALGALLVSLF